MLHDPNAVTVPDRVAALACAALYAQPPARIVTLTRGHAPIADDGTVQLRLGGTGITVPPSLDELLTQLPATRPAGIAARLHHGDWLFPGRRPGQHLHATRLAQRLRALGVDPRADRNTALLQLAPEVPPAVLADLLGLHIGTAISWANEAGGDWTNFAAIRATADIASHQWPGSGVERLALVELLIAANPESRLPYLLRLPNALHARAVHDSDGGERDNR